MTGRIFATADDIGRHPLFSIDAGSGKVTTLFDKGTSNDPNVAGDRVVFVHDDLQHPGELWTVDAKGGHPRAITHLNDAKVATITWGEAEQFSFAGAKGDKVYGWLVKPPGARPGAQGAGRVPDSRRAAGVFRRSLPLPVEPEVFAGHGYATIVIDFHGSTGYGQAFTDAIRGDWGGAPVRGSDEGARRGAREVPVPRQGPHGRARRVVRRVHDQLDQRQDRPLQGARLPRRQPRRDARVLPDRGAVVSGVGAQGAFRGRTRTATRGRAR